MREEEAEGQHDEGTALVKKRFKAWIVTFVVCAATHQVISQKLAPFRAVFESLEVELPGLVTMYYDLQGLLGGWGGVVAVLVVGYITAIPVIRKWRHPQLARLYVAGAVLMILSFAIPANCLFTINKLRLAMERTDPAPSSSIR